MYDFVVIVCFFIKLIIFVCVNCILKCIILYDIIILQSKKLTEYMNYMEKLICRKEAFRFVLFSHSLLAEFTRFTG